MRILLEARWSIIMQPVRVIGGLIAASMLLPVQVVLAGTPRSAAPLVQTAEGTVEGKVAGQGVVAFLGIPYAKPPVRSLRWRAPEPVQRWTGALHADRFGPECFQPMRGPETNQYSGGDTLSEDCLYVNVWTKPKSRDAPVIVYIHGGAFYAGSGSVGIYNGEAIAREGAVFVNFNYRVGPLGYLALPELRKESPHGATGNYGFLDQIAALQWVRRNIARFGGNPQNVMIVGQSAGSMSVLTLQASPLAKGLFQKAFGMSGAMLDGAIRLPTREQAEQDGEKLRAAWNARDLADLRAMAPDRLVVPRVPGGPTTGPSVDGYVLPATLSDRFAARQQSDVPLLLGFTSDESLGGLGPVTTLSQYQDSVRKQFGESAAHFLKLYPANSDAEARAQARIASRDATMVTGMFGWARRQTEHGTAPVYSYMFSRPHSFVPGVKFTDLDPETAGAYHTSEVPFWFGTLEAFNRYRLTRAWTEQDRAMSRSMMEALLSFSRSGTPEAAGITWPKFELPRPKLVEIAEEMSIKNWPDAEKIEFFKNFYAMAATNAK